MKYIKKMSSVELPKINGSVVDTFNVTDKTTNAPSIRAVENILSYSTEETFTGQYWIDGRKIYRKAFAGTTSSGQNTTMELGNNIEPIKWYGNIHITSLGSYISIDYPNEANSIMSFVEGTNPMVFVIHNKGSNGYYASKPFKAVVEYIKTTD